MSQYIPDLTERFPEGFDGVDLTDTFFGGTAKYPAGYFDRNDYMCDMEIPYETEDSTREISSHKEFQLGEEYRQVGYYGGVTYYKVEEIDRENNRILLSETWEDLDGSGTRPAKWHKLTTDYKGNEKALEWTSRDIGDIYILARTYVD